MGTLSGANLEPFMAEPVSRRLKSPVGLADSRPTSPLLGFRYPLVVAAIAAPLFLLYSYPYAENSSMSAGIQSYLSGYARMVGALLSLLDPQIAVDGNQIHGRIFSMKIVQTCDAMEVNILLAAAIAGFPMPLGRRVVTVILSVLSLLSINVVRLCVLYWLGAHAPSWFSRTHETLAPLFLVTSALAIFLLATRWRVRRFPENPT